MFRLSHLFIVFASIFSFLFVLPSQVYACSGGDYWLLHRTMPKQPTDADVIAEVSLTDLGYQAVIVTIVRVIKTSDERVRPGEKIPVKYLETTCGPYGRKGDQGLLFAKAGTDIENQLVLCYSPRADDLDVSDCNPSAIKKAKAIKHAAEEGEAASQLYLAHMYEYGKNVRQDNMEALEWFKRAANNGNAEAMANLGEIYEHGLLGVRQDDAEAISWLRRAVKLGGDKARSKLKDLKRIKSLKEAANNGDIEAQYELGEVFFYRNYNLRLNDDIRREYSAEAIKLFKLAAERGHAKAMCKLGDMYLGLGYGPSIAFDETEAAKWHRLCVKE